MRTGAIWLCAAVLACACGKAGGGTGGSTGGGDLMMLAPDELDVANRDGRGSNAVQAMATVSDSLFSFDPTLDTAKTALQNAQAIQDQASLNLNGCGSAALSGTTVTVDFGTSCTLKNGVTASGSASLAVSVASGTITVAATFTSLKVNSQSLDGSVRFVTSNATTFTTTGTLTTADGTFTIDLTLTGSSSAITIDGTLAETSGMTRSTFTFTAVVWKKGDCYPSSGSVKVVRGPITSVITFNSSTPTTGTASVTVGRKTTSIQLPTYGSCP